MGRFDTAAKLRRELTACERQLELSEQRRGDLQLEVHLLREQLEECRRVLGEALTRERAYGSRGEVEEGSGEVVEPWTRRADS